MAENTSWLLAQISQRMGEVPQARLIDSATSAVTDFEIAISSLPSLLCEHAHAQHRLDLIRLDHLSITLTEAILTFSELETDIIPSMTDREIADWNDQQGVQVNAISRITERLHRQISSLSLMWSIVQW